VNFTDRSGLQPDVIECRSSSESAECEFEEEVTVWGDPYSPESIWEHLEWVSNRMAYWNFAFALGYPVPPLAPGHEARQAYRDQKQDTQDAAATTQDPPEGPSGGSENGNGAATPGGGDDSSFKVVYVAQDGTRYDSLEDWERDRPSYSEENGMENYSVDAMGHFYAFLWGADFGLTVTSLNGTISGVVQFVGGLAGLRYLPSHFQVWGKAEWNPVPVNKPHPHPLVGPPFSTPPTPKD
jgi:hypothetical protein